MKKSIVWIFLLPVLFIATGNAQGLITLENQRIELSMDENGNLISLKNRQTGHNYASGKPLWRLYFDRKNEKDIQVLAAENKPVISRGNNHVVLTYNMLRTRKEEMKYTLTLKIVLEEKMVRFCSEVVNNEPHTVIRELQYPLISDCQVPPDHQLLTTQVGGKIYPNPLKQILSVGYSYMGPDQYFRQMSMKYPAGVSSNCFALTGKYQGLYFGSHDPTFQDTWHGMRVYPDQNHDFNQLEAGLFKYPSCLPGQTWENDANVVAPYSGSWHETSKFYRTWANTWWNHREEPQWIKEMNGFQRIIMRHQYGETFFTFNDFATRVKEAGESVGINVVFPFGWWNSGMDNGYPDSYYVTDKAQGGDVAFKKAIAEFQKDGGKVLLYFNGKLIDTESEYYRKGDGKKVCFNSNTGTEITEAYRFSGPGTFTGYYDARSFVVADTKNPKWQKKLIEMADRTIELGGNSVFYDQLGYGEATGIWDLSKEFPVPELCVIADKGKALKMAHDYIETKDKNLAIGTEHITDVTSQYCDYVHSVTDFAAGNCFIDWFRYTFPEIILSDRNVDGDEQDIEWLMNQNVLLGIRNNLQIYRLRGLISETPAYQQYLAKVNKLKDKYRSLLLLGTYRDTEGFSIGGDVIKARSFVNGNRMAVVMTHRSGDKQMTRISVPGYRYEESDGVGDQSVSAGTNEDQSVILGKNALAVLVYVKK